MSSRPDLDDALRSSLRQAHEEEPPAPGFQLLWNRARASRESSRPSRPGLRWALASLALALSLGLIFWQGAERRSGPAGMPPRDALALAEELSSWTGSHALLLDSLAFLDDAPGQELYDSFPQVYQVPEGVDDIFNDDWNPNPKERS